MKVLLSQVCMRHMNLFFYTKTLKAVKIIKNKYVQIYSTEQNVTHYVQPKMKNGLLHCLLSLHSFIQSAVCN